MFENLGHYKILDRIGEGGIGEVYRARDTRVGRTVALKILGPDLTGDAPRRERLLRDAQAAARVSHPNIAVLYEIGEDQGQHFLAFEFVAGDRLSAVMSGRPLNPRRAIDLAIQIADALADAHAVGMVHGDIKPDNVIVTLKGNAKILDFGLANWTAGGRGRAQTPTAPLTTAAYLSPEQAIGEPVDERTDIFSLGIVLFEMLTGRLPFTGATPTAMALQIAQAPAPSASSVVPSLPRELDAIVAKALAKSLDQRCQSAATMAAELRAVAAVLDARSTADEEAWAPAVKGDGSRAGRPRLRGALILAGALLLVLVLIFIAAAMGWLGRGAIPR
jgi:serine/threonine-protein kinase